MERKRVQSGAPWESAVGYCRAIRAGQMVFVSGTAPVDDDGGAFGPGDPQAQARRCLERIDAALMQLGATHAHVVRTRMFVTDIGQWEAFGRAHAAFFGPHRPATSMVEVARLIDPEMLIEIEAEAVLPG